MTDDDKWLNETLAALTPEQRKLLRERLDQLGDAPAKPIDVPASEFSTGLKYLREYEIPVLGRLQRIMRRARLEQRR